MALDGARREDGGPTTGQRCRVISQRTIGDDALLPGGGSQRVGAVRPPRQNPMRRITKRGSRRMTHMTSAQGAGV